MKAAKPLVFQVSVFMFNVGDIWNDTECLISDKAHISKMFFGRSIILRRFIIKKVTVFKSLPLTISAINDVL